MTSVWHEPDFIAAQLTQAVGQTMCLTSLVFFAVQHFRPEDAMSFEACFQIARSFGGQLGTTAIQVFTRHAEQTHSQLLGSHVGTFDIEVLSRCRPWRLALLRACRAAAPQTTAPYCYLIVRFAPRPTPWPMLTVWRCAPALRSRRG